MFFAEMLIAVALAAILIGLLSPADRYGTQGGLVCLAFFFLLFFPVIWASGVWLSPVGPAIGGVYWLSFLLPATFLLLLLFALDPGPRVRKVNVDSEAEEITRAESAGAEGVAIVFSAFFWVLLLAAAVALLFAYV